MEDSNCFPEITIEEWDWKEEAKYMGGGGNDEEYLEYWLKDKQEEEARCVRCYGKGHYEYDGKDVNCPDCKGAGRFDAL